MRRLTVIWVLVAAAALAAGAWLSSCGATDNGGGGDSDTDGDSDSDTDSDSDGDCESDTPIYDVRQGVVTVDEVVTLCGVVVMAPTLVDSGDGSGTIYVEEPDAGPWSGIVLYVYSDALLEIDVARGDIINVTGAYSEFYGLSEIEVAAATDLEVTGTADSLPEAEIVDPASVNTTGADAESYESVLVGVQDVTVTAAPDEYGQWQVTGDLLVADTFFEEAGGPSGPNIEVALDDTFETIYGMLEFSYEEFKLSPRDQDDYVGWSGSDSDTDTDTDADVTIYEIQQGDVTVGDGVIVSDVVVTSPLTFDSEGFFVEEQDGGQYSGIYVYNFNAATDPASVAVGDLVTITGTYYEYYDNSEIEIEGGAGVTFLDTGTVPDPVAISDPATIATGGDDAEAYEGVLVTVSDVAVTNAAADAFGCFEVDDSLWVGSVFFTDYLVYTVGDTFTSITGPMYYSYDNAKLEPRTLADLVE